MQFFNSFNVASDFSVLHKAEDIFISFHDHSITISLAKPFVQSKHNIPGKISDSSKEVRRQIFKFNSTCVVWRSWNFQQQYKYCMCLSLQRLDFTDCVWKANCINRCRSELKVFGGINLPLRGPFSWAVVK